MPRLILAGSVHRCPVPLFTAADAPDSRFRSDTTLLRVRPGVYATAAQWSALTPWDRYLARVHAFARTHPDAIFSHESAAALHGLPVFGEPRHIHVFDPSRYSSRRWGDVCVHTGEDPREIDARDGLRLTSLAHTTLDLMKVLPPAFALAVADAAGSARQGGTVAVSALAEIAASRSDSRGGARVAMLLPLIDARSESPGESVSRAVIVWSGFEPPDLQREFRTGPFTDRVDFTWLSVRALGESDGYEKYRADDSSTVVQRLMDEKRREDRLRRKCRAFTRWEWADAVRVRPLVQKLDEIGIARVGPSRDALLATLATNPRSLLTARNHSSGEKHRNA